jgi:hypothetical protein
MRARQIHVLPCPAGKSGMDFSGHFFVQPRADIRAPRFLQTARDRTL